MLREALTKEEQAIKVWEICKRNLSPEAQVRVRRRVIKGMTLEKAVKREGAIFCQHTADLSNAVVMFQDETFTVDEPSGKIISEDEMTDMFGEGGKEEVKEAFAQETPKGFIPRPKTKK